MTKSWLSEQRNAISDIEKYAISQILGINPVIEEKPGDDQNFPLDWWDNKE